MPLFIAVILWDKGLTISDISSFIALTAVGFVVALYCWDRLRAQHDWGKLISLSFILQSLFVMLLICGNEQLIATAGALINGAAGCFYWSTQRLLFQAITEDKNTGNTFGNFQILVVFALKIGVLIGSYLLGMEYFSGLLLLSFVLSILGFLLVHKSLNSNTQLEKLKQVPAFTLKQVVKFQDQHRSSLIFVVDGLFLFLESYFWMLTIYMLTQENVMQLGLILIALSILLALIFFVIKKYIDRVDTQKVYRIAVLGYASSWVIRGVLDIEMDSILIYSGLLLAAFLSNFFRLAFNKRFYDIARQDKPTRYIICKSYYSQFMLVVFFSIIAVFTMATDTALHQLQVIYYLCTPLVLVYFVYGQHSKPAVV
ncbi:MFS transporter [Psychromonas sp. 14N.309.X.WAT.B.A12]|uniref:MFS transporter n=1 Tax=Psychromonas sp. 14N.309.X.WAT.B.A12 TaxID=2998322 RepID=UPI0025AEF5C2|nr:MFS transporter [Psychromonas sp. 14N.309.X.WAT.B.A12]MDN2664519.1 MFS transporter [Psychromonas sp. 14N.309.X.WAT.B.A12]